MLHSRVFWKLYGSQDYLKMAASFGAQRALAKPFSYQEILAAIHEVFQG